MKYKKHDLIESVNEGYKYYCKNCEKDFKTRPNRVCEAKIETKIKMGKHSRAAGKRFELKVREKLEQEGWIVDRWTNQVEFEEFPGDDGVPFTTGKLVPIRAKWNNFTKRLMMNSGGFPDFICIRYFDNLGTICNVCDNAITFGGQFFEVQFVECKMNGVLDKLEKQKVEWIKTNLKIQVIIASKGNKRGEIKCLK